ncbi:hypothetical protein SF23_12430 [Streptomyces sp. MBRL 10]|nr:hypothetical protein SF23_12430 [Streptomyces sp. MBRL 10]
MPQSGLDGAMDRQRQALGLTWRQVAETAGISYETLRAIRRGEQAGSDLTRRGLERALKWTVGGFEVAEAGGIPDAAPEPSAQGSAEGAMPASDPQVDAILTILDGLPPRVQEEVLRRLGERLPPASRAARPADAASPCVPARVPQGTRRRPEAGPGGARRARTGRDAQVIAYGQVRGVNGSGSSPAPGTPRLSLRVPPLSPALRHAFS